MTGPPLVTVLMCVHNGLPFLREAVESVLAQTMNDFEFLVVDDASTDESAACVEAYRDPRIRLVRNERNLGTSGSMNRGTALARATYIARIDQDDVCLPERLEAQIEFLERRSDLAAVCSWEYTIDAAGRKVRAWRRILENYGAFLGYLVVGKSPVWHPSITFRKEALVSAGGYDGRYSPAEDFDVSMRLGLKRYNAGIVPRVLVLQREHGRRQSVTRASGQWSMTKHIHDDMIRRFAPTPAPETLGLMLRVEEEFWARCRSRSQIVGTLEALDGMLGNMSATFRLSAEESRALRRTVYRRLGPGVRLGTRLAGLPDEIFRLAFFGLSPLLVPSLRRSGAMLYQTYRQLRFPLSLLGARWGGESVPGTRRTGT